MNGPRTRAYQYAGPDFEVIINQSAHIVIRFFFQEGPHSVMNEEEFFDALEIAYHDDEMLTVSCSLHYDRHLVVLFE